MEFPTIDRRGDSPVPLCEMGSLGGNQMALVNVMEKFVDEKLEQMLNGENCCKCTRCLEDMKAIALNKLPAKYVSSHNGELFTKLSTSLRQSSVDINVAVANAIECVANHPSHDGIITEEPSVEKAAI